VSGIFEGLHCDGTRSIVCAGDSPAAHRRNATLY
jgi:hypothetical protein